MIVYNPDDLALTKPEILQLIKDTIKEYKHNKKVTSAGLFLLTFCKFAKDEEIESLWRTVTNKTNQLLIKNSLKHGEINNERWTKVYKQLAEGKHESK